MPVESRDWHLVTGHPPHSTALDGRPLGPMTETAGMDAVKSNRNPQEHGRYALDLENL